MPGKPSTSTVLFPASLGPSLAPGYAYKLGWRCCACNSMNRIPREFGLMSPANTTTPTAPNPTISNSPSTTVIDEKANYTTFNSTSTCVSRRKIPPLEYLASSGELVGRGYGCGHAFCGKTHARSKTGLWKGMKRVLLAEGNEVRGCRVHSLKRVGQIVESGGERWVEKGRKGRGDGEQGREKGGDKDVDKKMGE